MIIEIGRQRTVTVRIRKQGKLVPKIGLDGSPETKLKSDYVERITRSTLGFGFGPDSRRQLIVRLVSPDQIEFRPYKTRRAVRAHVRDIYRHVLLSIAQSENLRKARERKAKKAERLAIRRIDAAERRLREAAKKGE